MAKIGARSFLTLMMKIITSSERKWKKSKASLGEFAALFSNPKELLKRKRSQMNCSSTLWKHSMECTRMATMSNFTRSNSTAPWGEPSQEESSLKRHSTTIRTSFRKLARERKSTRGTTTLTLKWWEDTTGLHHIFLKSAQLLSAINMSPSQNIITRDSRSSSTGLYYTFWFSG